ncbi:AAA-like domain-containing protein [Phormidium sp. CLA17]|uniref:AAA-like domain-containing protein n=1 Tax=Leptolyngbya sp. Cla-17 TaxID=2803751 RepID=UPI001491D2FE|nr:AAA-like domain-containing protein [Leptolyngbya sp. Cla-17]MBM0743348.1 AAA-like domain-containing protein [Leptolyngbya sp. Cla-17]
MNIKEALEIVDRLLYVHTGKYLTDLEREVFIGSWNGQTYEEIYPINPEYVEKYVGYKLWRKISDACGEKVTKKQLRGALERALQRQPSPTATSVQPVHLIQKVFISHRHQEPDVSLARKFFDAIAAAGHEPFMTDTNLSATPSKNQDWLKQIDSQLQQCDYFLLLLSPQAAVSEMVIEELERAKYLQGSRKNSKPLVLSIRINWQPHSLLNHDVQSYLEDSPQREWHSPVDTADLAQAIVRYVNGTESWTLGDRAQPQPVHFQDHSAIEAKDPSPQNSQFNLFPTETLPVGEASPKDSQNPLSPRPSPLLLTPSPTADPELPQGQVRLDSALYIERSPHEAQCYREILQPGTLIRIKAPRQMGKTSLMSRILYQARAKGFQTVPLSFQHADVGIFSSLSALLQWFCGKVARKLRLPHQIDQYWTDMYGSKDNCTLYFEDCLLSKIESPLVLGLDEVDRIFQYPKIADDFFGLLRAWYEEAGYGGNDSGLWEKLRLVVVHSTEVYIPLDVNQSPFNVGLPIELSEFNPTQVADLVQRHGLDWQPIDVEQLMAIAGGHPYLVRLALYHLAQHSLTLSDLIHAAPTEAGIYGDHLRRHLWNLKQHPELANAFNRVVTNPEPTELDSILAFKLHSMGLVHLQGNEVTPRFDLYRRYFSERLERE